MSITNLLNPVCNHSKSMVDLSFKIESTPYGKNYSVYKGHTKICSVLGTEKIFLDGEEKPYAWMGYGTLQFKKNTPAKPVDEWLIEVPDKSYNVVASLRVPASN